MKGGGRQGRNAQGVDWRGVPCCSLSSAFCINIPDVKWVTGDCQRALPPSARDSSQLFRPGDYRKGMPLHTNVFPGLLHFVSLHLKK